MNDEDKEDRVRIPDPPRIKFTPPTIPEVGKEVSGRFAGATGNSPADMGKMGLASAIGLQLVSAIGGGVLVGMALDKYVLKTTGTPWGLVGGFFLGTIAGFMNLIRLTNQLNDDSDSNKKS